MVTAFMGHGKEFVDSVRLVSGLSGLARSAVPETKGRMTADDSKSQKLPSWSCYRIHRDRDCRSGPPQREGRRPAIPEMDRGLLSNCRAKWHQQGNLQESLLRRHRSGPDRARKGCLSA